MRYAKTVEEYLKEKKDRQSLLNELRRIVLSLPLMETIKWGMPVYTWSNKNIVGLGAFKSYAGLWFFQGALLTDKAKVLVNAQKGKTKAMRQWRFEGVEEVRNNETLIRSYIEEALENQKAGKEIRPGKKIVPGLPELMEEAFADNVRLKSEFANLSDSCKREYIEYIVEAKRDDTKKRRLEKITPMILSGAGLNDAYK